jgi:hypothetical protein
LASSPARHRLGCRPRALFFLLDLAVHTWPPSGTARTPSPGILMGVNRRPILRPGYVVGTPGIHHFVIVKGEGTPVEDERRALCGTYVDGIDEQRPLWNAGGQPCAHCARRFDVEGLGGELTS